MENVITLGKLLSLCFCFLLHSILFLISQTSYRTYKIISSNDLARPVMGTIFLVCMSVGLSTIVYGKTIQKNGMPKCVGGITWSKHAHAQSQFCEFETKCHFETLILPSSGRSKPTCDTRIIHFYYTLE